MKNDAEHHGYLPILTVLALLTGGAMFFFPLWGMSMEAPQYPETDISVQVYPLPSISNGSEQEDLKAHTTTTRVHVTEEGSEGNESSGRISPPGYVKGNLEEIKRLNQYIGVSLPAYIPEIRVVKWMVGMALFLLFLSVIPYLYSHRAKLLGTAIGIYVMVTVGGLAILQYRLYVLGHDRPAKTPLKGVEDFAPPVIGWVEVGNFDVSMYPEIGGLLLFASLVFAGVAFYFSLEKRFFES